ncbi:hypothetical protein SRHO_G00029030 [Serrasalmus rhombeus]
MLHHKDGQTSATYFSWLCYGSALELRLLQPGNSEAFVPSVMGPDEEPFEERYRSAVRKKRVQSAPLGVREKSRPQPLSAIQSRSTSCGRSPDLIQQACLYAASLDCLSNKSTLAFFSSTFICMHRPTSLAGTRTKRNVLIKHKTAARQVNMCPSTAKTLQHIYLRETDFFCMHSINLNRPGLLSLLISLFSPFN